MKLNKDIRIRILYILILYIIYSFLLDKYNYVAKYLTNFIFILFIFIKFIFGQLDFYAERFRYKDVFITLGIDVIFSVVLYAFWKQFNIFYIYLLIYLFFIFINFQKNSMLHLYEKAKCADIWFKSYKK